MQISNGRTLAKSMIDFSKSANSKSNSQSTQKGSLGGLVKSYTKQASSTQGCISNLMDRKQAIMDMKEEYKSRAKEQGLDKQSIDAKIAEYDGQISQIDMQIADLEQKNQKKAAGAKEDSGDKADKTEQAAREATVNESMIKAFASAQTAQEHIEVVQHTASVLKVDALAFKPSQAFSGNPEKYAELTSRADGLQNKIAEMEQSLQKSGKQIADTTLSSQPNEEKTAQEKAVEQYQQTADGYQNEDDADLLDTFA